MPYCTIDQLTDRYGASLLLQLSDRAETAATEIDADLFARAIADADALIDGYLKPVYALPLAATPSLVTDISQRVSIYYAHGNTASDKITADYKDAMAQLKDIGSGKIKLDAAGVEPASSGGAEVITNEPERPMTAETMKGFI